MEVILRVRSGPHAGQEYRLDRPDTFVVGRSAQAQFSMHEDRLLSREHFRIELSPPLCRLHDLGSTNGTKVNGLRVETTTLRDGDKITAGDSSFQIELVEGARPPVRCLGCGQAATKEALAATPDDSRVFGWLCPNCAARRKKFPATHSDYLIERRIGGGGMGEVFLARQLSTNRPVAIKMMGPIGASNPKAKEYFRREMEVLKNLLMPTGQCHPNIVAFYDIFEIDNQFQLVMEHVAGKNAQEWVASLSTSLPIATAARIGRLLLSALEYAHSRGYVHRDIKPSNLLLMGPTQRPQLKLSDFGLAKNFRDNEGALTRQGDIGGSVGFISPDHIREFSEVKEPADIYSAGATLYYLLTLHYPYLNFDPRRGDAYQMVLEHPPVPLRAHRPDAPEGLERVLRKALEKQPGDRWKSAAAMAEALRPFLEGTS
jgi:serine/threonine-protein kinase